MWQPLIVWTGSEGLRMFKKVVAGIASLATMVAVGNLPAQQPEAPGAEGMTTLRASTALRVLDVTVVDKNGNPVTTGLTRDDFTILDNKKKKEILSLDGPTGGTGTTSLPTSTIFIIDHVNTPFEDEYWQMHEMEGYLKSQGDLLNQQTEILLLTDAGLQVVEGFTRDRNDLLDAVKAIHSVNPYRLTSNWDVENLSLSMSALEEVALQTKMTPGRKNVLWLGSGGAGLSSDGMYHRPLVQRYVRRTANLLVESRVTLFLILPALKISGTIQSPSGPSPLKTSVDPLNGSGIAPFAVPMATDPFTGGVNMSIFAKTTGGRVFLNSNDLVTEIGESVSLGTKYYTLAYKPDAEAIDGGFKHIEVKIKDRNLRVLTKGGYFAVAKDDDVRGGENEVRYEVRKAAVSAVPFPELGVQVKGLTHYAPEQTSVFELDLKPGELKMEPGADGVWKGEIVIAAVSTDSNHDILASASKAMAVTASTASMAHAQVPVLKVSINLRVPRRTSTLRFVVRDMSFGKMGAFDMPRKMADATPIAAGPMPVPQPKGSAVPAAEKTPGL